MSNQVFPMPLTNSTNGARGWPIEKHPVFNTIVQTPVSRRGETRISTTPYCTWDFSMTFPYVGGTFNDSTSYLNQVAGFYMSMQGAANSWLFNDPRDNSVITVNFGTGDGTTKTFQLTRPIGQYNDIIQNLNGTPTIYINGVSTTAFSINSLGVVTFTSAPANGAALAWTGSFYFRCRFKNDTLDLKEIFTNFWVIGQLEWSSIIV